MSLIYQHDHHAMKEVLEDILQKDVEACIARAGLDVDCDDCPHDNLDTPCPLKERIEKINAVLN